MIQSEEDQGRISSFTSPGSADPDPCWRQNHPHSTAMCGEVVVVFGCLVWRCRPMLMTTTTLPHVRATSSLMSSSAWRRCGPMWTMMKSSAKWCLPNIHHQIGSVDESGPALIRPGPDPSMVDWWWFRISTTIGSTSDVWFNVCRFVGYLIDCFSLVLAG